MAVCPGIVLPFVQPVRPTPCVHHSQVSSLSCMCRAVVRVYPLAFSYSLISCINVSKKRLKVMSLPFLHDAFSQASHALETLWRSSCLTDRFLIEAIHYRFRILTGTCLQAFDPIFFNLRRSALVNSSTFICFMICFFL